MTISSFSEELLVPLIIGTFLFSSLTTGLVIFILRYKKAQQKFDWERQQHKQALLQTEIEIREQTLEHISRELHDNLGQVASLIKINLNLVSNNVSNHDREKINESIELQKRIIADIKSLSFSLNRDSINRIGLKESIEADVTRINRAGQLRIDFTFGESMPELSADVEIFLYRMCQEALNNAVKHSEATQARVELNYEPNRLQILINDNGRGFDARVLNKQTKGSGLHNLLKRCELIGAHCDIKSEPGLGTTICINLPIVQKHGKQ